ncbi:hypothetical protein CY34DRAFT_98930 [Suillus luteus UH-Slu-Lm8-n1]|uniref:Unplaced genomic scaffold CY34scaffold_728, whole genome shotgun sequence n=1 Tax=Suillus luteus UH-Slu-Lm8-n1 TaxID=930992 RepID=A0A0C9Z8L2_9AGAM|nr:hypothetical protein CY34DRAFT_98930 [Suillus luteus UH-Slu-Lm8-n1]
MEADSERRNKLNLLALYLKNLPDDIPLVHSSATAYGFDFYVADDDESVTIDMGAIGALNRAFEIRLGQHNNRPIIFKERGAGLEGVVDVLKSYLQKPAKLDSKVLANHEDPHYVDLSDPKDTWKGGAKTHPLLLKGSI